MEDVVHDEPLRLSLAFRYLEARLEHLVHVFGLEVGTVAFLYACHLVVAEPVGSLLFFQFVEHLGVELLVVDGRAVVHELACRYSDADVTSASRGVAERLFVVGGGKEGSVARAVFLTLAEDGYILCGVRSVSASLHLPSLSECKDSKLDLVIRALSRDSGLFRDISGLFLKKMRVRGKSRGKKLVYIWVSRKIYLSLHA